MKRLDHKSNCAINYALEMIGDQWSMLIVRDIVYFGKHTFGEFLGSPERIATSALSRRLKDLEDKGILIKTLHIKDKRKEVYNLTDKGLDLIPTLLELAEWGAGHDPDTGASQKWISHVAANKTQVICELRQKTTNGEATFSNQPLTQV